MPIVEIHRLRIDPSNGPRLLEIRGAAMAELREQVPELWQADLVRLGDDVWLEICTWSRTVDPGRIESVVAGSPPLREMRRLLAERVGLDRGERVHTTGTAWAAGR